ncbi:2Fe-2S iron-sulfur cluster-binding protein [Pseudooceanicola sp.]|uniref:2Fe-2S iron-sulfur cluster-binding protein n=1 Tax=Pseudooceanicola sp. TaxID=1914328 RepID=UPI00262BF79A|nr:2Fe-2S iron-sulfur cluster-binding protein [Pseudooceanicola sp.]MDF1853867.1 2Fe-2S iron-sulfur cluster-binding protein [Pseudooceanicola sp.]
MPRIIYKTYDGTRHEIEVAEGTSVMEGAVQNGIQGIDGDCGGACACATCHIQVPDQWLAMLEPQSDMELSMLDFAEGVGSNSRLGCQISVSSALDGIEVLLPENQH